MTTDSPPNYETFHHRSTVVDLHAHPSLKTSLFQRNLSSRYRTIKSFFWPLSVRTNFPALQQGGVDVLLSAVYAPEKRILEDYWLLWLFKLLRHIPFTLPNRIWNQLFKPPYFVVTNRLLDEFEDAVERHNRGIGSGSSRRRAVVVRSLAELEESLREGEAAPHALIHAVEGAHCLEGDTGSANEILANLDALFNRGVAALTLGHFYPNQTVMPVFPFPEFTLPLLWRRRREKLWRDIDLTAGLTATGRKVVERMAELGMLIDVSHCTPLARRQVYQMMDDMGKRSLVMATHVGAYAINPSPYNLDDEEIRWIADHGGVVGVIFMNYWLMPHETKLGLNFISRTIEHFVQAAGGRTTHVAIGTDFDGFTDPPDDLKDAAEMSRLTERLFAEFGASGQRKYTDDDIENILGQNTLRVLRDGWGR